MENNTTGERRAETLPFPSLLTLVLKTGLAWAIVARLGGAIFSNLLLALRGLWLQFDLPMLLAALLRPGLGLIADLAVGTLSGLILYLLRRRIFARARPWTGRLTALCTLGLLSLLITLGPAIGMRLALSGVVNIFLQFLVQDALIALLVFYWAGPPPKRWLDWVMGALFILLVVGPLAKMMFLLRS